MANTNNWGKVYCFTEFGFEQNTIIYSVPEFSAANCFVSPKVSGQITTLALTIDTTVYKVDKTNITLDQTVI